MEPGSLVGHKVSQGKQKVLKSMSEKVIVTALVENTVNVGGLRAEHGLSLLIRAGGKKLLFDTGQSDLLLSNAEKMGLTLNDVDSVVLSHGHYDHTGGVEAIGRVAPQAKFFAHPAMVAPKFAANVDGTSRFIGLAPSSVELFRSSNGRMTWTAKPTEVMPGFFVTGEVLRTNLFEDTGGRFFLDAGCTRPDPLLDDQALYFDTVRGLVVILGCAHAGVVNTLAFIRDLTANRPFHAIIGGMHLLAAGQQRMEATVDALRRWAPKNIYVAHCTGTPATAQLWNAFPGTCSSCPVGTSLVFEK
jgi:7,8-dihydropterin-6-yl-methyl-4-(beta-D-ribofuranosyl)aminobenzene 5'-phosphate synthase